MIKGILPALALLGVMGLPIIKIFYPESDGVNNLGWLLTIFSWILSFVFTSYLYLTEVNKTPKENLTKIGFGVSSYALIIVSAVSCIYVGWVVTGFLLLIAAIEIYVAIKLENK